MNESAGQPETILYARKEQHGTARLQARAHSCARQQKNKLRETPRRGVSGQTSLCAARGRRLRGRDQKLPVFDGRALRVETRGKVEEPLRARRRRRLLKALQQVIRRDRLVVERR